MNRLRMPVVVGAVVALGLVGLTGCGDDTPEATPSPSPSSSQPSASPTADATPSSSTQPGGDLQALTYFVGDTPQGPKLYAEALSGVTPEEPVAHLLDGPTDSDYRTLLPAGSIEPHFHFDGIGSDGAFGIVLTDASWEQRPAGMSDRDARLAVQQLVWTLNSIRGNNTVDTSQRDSAEVDFYVDHQEVSFLGIPSGVKPEPELDVLATVNVLSPADGATVKDTFTASGLASSFEATVPWQVVDSTGKVVLENSAMADGWMDKLYPWTAEVDVSKLAPGDYTFVARTDDPSGGEGGGPTEDTKKITVP